MIFFVLDQLSDRFLVRVLGNTSVFMYTCGHACGDHRATSTFVIQNAIKIVCLFVFVLRQGLSST